MVRAVKDGGDAPAARGAQAGVSVDQLLAIGAVAAT